MQMEIGGNQIDESHGRIERGSFRASAGPMPAAASEFRFRCRLRSRRAGAGRPDRRRKATMPRRMACPARRLERSERTEAGIELVAVIQADHCKERFLAGVLKFQLGKHPVLHSRGAIDDNRRDRRQIDAAIVRLADAKGPAGFFSSLSILPMRSWVTPSFCATIISFPATGSLSNIRTGGSESRCRKLSSGICVVVPSSAAPRLDIEGVARRKHYRRGESVRGIACYRPGVMAAEFRGWQHSGTLFYSGELPTSRVPVHE